MEIFDDLEAEQDRLESLLTGLDMAAWTSPSAAPGWSITDVVLHLAQTEEAVVSSVAGAGRADLWERGDRALDSAVDEWVSAERADPTEVFARWQTARRSALSALRGAAPQQRVPWAATPLKPTVLATTRLAEHWAHGLDITQPLQLPFEDSARLRHVAWLGHRTLPYAFSVAGQESHDVHCVLTAPDGATWTYGPHDADSRIEGPAGEFCRVGAHRLAADDSSLRTTGPHARAALRVLRNYAA
jgi:uncharacterized protein (TIGR03084 family)